MKVENMTNGRGNIVKNQFIITDNGAMFFQSYNSIIAKIKSGKTTLDRKTWDYSVTTSRFRNIFLGETTEDTRKKIKSGEYKLQNLNG